MTTTIRNLITDPRFTGCQWATYGAVITPVTEHYALNVTNSNSNDAFARLILQDVTAYRGVNMTLACSLSWISSNAQECANGLMFVVSNTALGNYTVLGNYSDGGTASTGRKALSFTIPEDTTILEVRLYAPALNNSTFQWGRPMLTRTEDYQLMLHGTGLLAPMDYFDYGTNPE